MAKAERDATEVENAQRLDKLPREVWEKILDLLDENDLLPLALSCRNFRQKQKELVARTKKRWPRGHKFRFALRTKLKQKIKKGQPASLEYLKFCSKDKVAPKTRQQLRPALGKNVVRKRAREVRALASFHGHLPLLQEALSGVKGGARVMHELIDSAVRGGQVETLQWLSTQKDFEMDRNCFASACKYGHLEVLKWLRSKHKVIQYDRTYDDPWDERAYASAAKEGHLDVLKWLRSEGCPWDEQECTSAVRGGHTEALKWLRSEGCPWNHTACQWAAHYGDIVMLKWLRSEGCPWNEETCEWAAKEGHRDVLKYLHENGCPWNKGTCKAAAWGGHLDVLKYARENGCPFGGVGTWGAAEESTREWLRENGFPQEFQRDGYSSDDDYYY